jgi:threonine aldolase
MSQEFKTHFGSDNHSGVHPQIMSALTQINFGHAAAYGSDDYTIEVIQKMKRLFSRESEIHFVFNGTAANVLALSCFAQSYHSVLTASTSHLWVDECGAPEKLLGAKLIPIPSRDGKLRVCDLSHYITRRGDQHSSQVIGISITQPTEYGTVYTMAELAELKLFADQHQLYLHMDGSRLVNAATHLGVSLNEVTKHMDVVSLGGTKNGLMFGEAVLILNNDLKKDFKFKRKQFMQLASKTKFIAAQFDAWLNTGLWSVISTHSLEMAQKLRQMLSEIPEIQITQKTESNAVFAIIPKHIVHALKKHHFFYIWDETSFEARLMLSFDSRESDLLDFVKKIKELLTSEQASLKGIEKI